MRFFSLLFIVLFICLKTIYAQPEKMQIAVVELQARGISQTEAQTFTDRLRSELVKTGLLTIIERSEMEEILKEQGFQLTGCTNDECVVEVGRLLNVRQICAGTVGKVGDIYSLIIRLIDVQSGKIIKSVTEDCQCPIEKVFTISLRNVALKIIGEYISINIQSNPSGATVFLNGIKQGETPLSISLTHNSRVQLKIRKRDYYDWTKSIVFKSENKTSINAELKKHKGKLKFSGDYNNAKLSFGKRTIQINKSEYDLPIGSYSFKILKPGYLNKKFSVNIQNNKITNYNVFLIPKTKNAAILRSGLVPGWGQSYQDKKTRSYLYSISFFACGVGSIVYTQKYNDAVTDYNKINDQYLSAVEDTDINFFRKELKDTFNSVESYENIRNTLYVTTTLIWIWNIVDILILPPPWTKKMYVSDVKTNDGNFLKLSYKF